MSFFQLNPNVKYTEEQFEVNSKGEKVVTKRDVIKIHKGVAHKVTEYPLQKAIPEGGLRSELHK